MSIALAFAGTRAKGFGGYAFAGGRRRGYGRGVGGQSLARDRRHAAALKRLSGSGT